MADHTALIVIPVFKYMCRTPRRSKVVFQNRDLISKSNGATHARTYGVHTHMHIHNMCMYMCTCACDMCMCMCMCMCMWKCSLYDRIRVYCVGSAVIILNDRIQRDGERTVTQSPDSHLSASVFSYRSLLTFTLLPKSMSPTSRRPSSRRTKVYPSLSYSAIAGSSPSSTWVAEIQRRYRGDTWEMQGRYRAVASRPQA